MSATTVRTRPDDHGKLIALVLQGGGALGSYQAGVFEALAAAGYHPGWVAGISIGAVNAAIIAGNPPERRVERLRAFWDEVTSPTAIWPSGVLPDGERHAGAVGALLFGQPGFFAPRSPLDWLKGAGATSYYDTAALRRTLERLVDFDRINARETRLSLGAVSVRTGQMVYFDNFDRKLTAAHVMASGALPPGFPSVEIDGEHYWDGGLVSNTPLQYLLTHDDRESTLIFQVDVFQSYGTPPTTLDQVGEREKDIRYASRTRVTTQIYEMIHNFRSAADDLWQVLPPEIRALPQAHFLEQFCCPTEMDIVQLIYRPFAPQGSTKDFEFSRGTMRARWAEGSADAAATLAASPWLEPFPTHKGVRVFDVLHDKYLKEAEHSGQR